MKTRNGFVSNSSSSSFVVVFPKCPESTSEVLKYMFEGKEGGVSLDYYGDGYSYNQIAERVYEDIVKFIEKYPNGLKLNDIKEGFVGRYHYSVHSGWQREYNDKYYNDKYFGLDKKSMDQYVQVENESEEKTKAIEEKKRLLIDANIKPVQYASEGIGSTPSQIKAWKRYQDKASKFRKTNDEYIKLEEERLTCLSEKWRELDILRGKIAEADAKAFFKDHKKGFIFGVEYGDESGCFEGTMEHGDIFRNLPHVVINGH